jgi:quinol monooxygenase YgiN
VSDSVVVTVIFTLKAEAVEPFAAALKAMFLDTKKKKGFRSIRLDRNSSEPDKLLLLEEWDSAEDYQVYIDWRTERGEGMDSVLTISTAPPQLAIWNTRMA